MKRRLIAFMISMFITAGVATACGDKTQTNVKETEEFVNIKSSTIVADEVVVKYDKEAQHHVGEAYNIIGVDYQGETKNGKQIKLKCGKEIVTSDPVTLSGAVQRYAVKTHKTNPEILCEECFDEYLVDNTANQ